MRIKKPYLAIRDTVGEAYREHAEHWRACEQCPLHRRRSNVVLYRGVLPATIVFLGEAPGRDEDFVGYPFVGQSGGLLQDAIVAVTKDIGKFRYAIANIIACVPWDTAGVDTRKPLPTEAYTCSLRLTDFYINLARPRLVFTMGEFAQVQHTDSMSDIRGSFAKGLVKPVVVPLAQPSSILEQPEIRAGKSYRRFVITIKTAIDQYVKHPNADTSYGDTRQTAGND